MVSNIDRESLAKHFVPKTTKYIKQTPFIKQSAFMLLNTMEALYGGAAGPGKAQTLDSIVWTPFGPRPMGEIEVGDSVCNPDGTPSKVVFVHDVGVKPVCRVTFADGSSTVAARDHLWLARIAGHVSKASKKYIHDDEPVRGRIFTTAELQDWVAKSNARIARGDYGQWPLVPLTNPVRFTRGNSRGINPIKMSPYVLGVLLGDGCLVANPVSFTSIDDEIINRVASELVDGELSVSEGKIAFRIVRSTTRQHLEELGLTGKKSGDKWIPKPYLLANLEDRWALIQGLMDTDGTCDLDGHCSYCTVSPQLAKDVRFLARSLGFAASITEKPYPFYRDKDGEKVVCQKAYIISIGGRNRDQLFSLTRKKVRTLDGGDISELRIVSVEDIGEAKCRCITVDHSNGLYLTDDFIVTHNSSALLMCALQYVDVPKYSALILRKTYSDLNLPGAIMDRAKEWLLDTDAQWRDKDKRFIFPSGATLTFGFLDSANDKYRYQGSEYQYIAFDELTQFPDKDYEYLFSRLRKPKGMPVPIRMRAASNPGGPYHSWVKKRFVDQGTTKDRVFIPARFYDNPHIDQQEYLAALGNLDDVTKAQLLDGDWDAKPQGLVYPGLADCAVEPWGERKEGIAVGGIDWGFTNPAVFLSGVLDNDGVLWVDAERYVRGKTLPEHIDALQDKKDVIWFADPAEPESIAQMRRADFVVRKGDNAITSGIKIMQDRIRKDKLRVSKDCKAFLEETGKYRYPSDKELGDSAVADGKTSELPIKEFEHSCFIAGTLVTTTDGEVPIEDIMPGDLVLTRQGWFPVASSGMTHESAEVVRVKFSDGRELVGTANHPVFTAENGWTRLDNIVNCGIIICHKNHDTVESENCQSLGPARPIASSTTASRFGDTQNQASPNSETITVHPAVSGFIGRSGNSTTDLFPTDTTSTTSIKTRSTTRSKTSSACQQGSIFRTTWMLSDARRQGNSPTPRFAKVTLRGPLPTRQRHSRVKSDEETSPKSGRTPSQKPTLASSAGGITNPSPPTPISDFARTIANRPAGERPASTTWTDVAKSAVLHFGSTDMLQNRHAQIFAAVVSRVERKTPVYNLEVAGCPEYFANGILVHNCDAARYLCVGIHKLYGGRSEDVEPVADSETKGPWKGSEDPYGRKVEVDPAEVAKFRSVENPIWWGSDSSDWT